MFLEDFLFDFKPSVTYTLDLEETLGFSTLSLPMLIWTFFILDLLSLLLVELALDPAFLQLPRPDFSVLFFIWFLFCRGVFMLG